MWAGREVPHLSSVPQLTEDQVENKACDLDKKLAAQMQISPVNRAFQNCL